VKTELRLIESPATPDTNKVPDELATARLRGEIFALVYRQMHSLAGRTSDFDDLVQMAAEQVFRSLSGFQERCAAATWTYRICYHTLLKQRRWYRRWIKRFVYTSDDNLPEDAERAPVQSTDLLERRERAHRLHLALNRLSPKRRTVVVLHDLDDLEIEEIAAIVGANVHTVRSRLRDGRRLLAQALEQDAYFGDEACKKEAK
jgi:RNA polymerase sigma-70 factor (ECF subfamily)